jgi:hypothetical protein
MRSNAARILSSGLVGSTEIGFGFGSLVPKFVRNAAKAAGRAVTAVTNIPVKGVTSVANLANKIPLVGPVISNSLKAGIGPITLANSIASGTRIDRALKAQLDQQLALTTSALPIAQTIVSIVPGIGSPVLAGALGMANSLANGAPLDQAVIDGIKGSLPGGPIAKMAFDATLSVVQGKRIDSALLTSAVNAIPGLPPAAKNAMLGALPLIQSIASGKPVTSDVLNLVRSQIPKGSQKAFDAARAAGNGEPMKMAELLQNQLPPAARKALTVGTAVAQAKKIQESVVGVLKSGNLQSLVDTGQDLIKKSAVYNQAFAIVPAVQKRGFMLGAAIMQQSGIQPQYLQALRNRLTPEERKGYDMALALHVGSVTAPRAPKILKAKARAAYYATFGMRSANQTQKQDFVQTIKKSPQAVLGLKSAVSTQKKNTGFWAWLKGLFGN